MLKPCRAGAFIAALAPVVAMLRAVCAPLAVGVTEAFVKLQVGPFVTEGETEHDMLTEELKPITEVTVIVDVAVAPGLPEAGDNAPFVM